MARVLFTGVGGVGVVGLPGVVLLAPEPPAPQPLMASKINPPAHNAQTWRTRRLMRFASCALIAPLPRRFPWAAGPAGRLERETIACAHRSPPRAAPHAPREVRDDGPLAWLSGTHPR